MATTPKRKPSVTRRMAPFTRDDLQLIRAALRTTGRPRDKALLEVGVDSMLRIGDLLSLRVRDVRAFDGGIHERFRIVQEKTEAAVEVTLTPKARTAISDLVAAEGKWSDDFLFTHEPHGPALSEWAVRLIIKTWARWAHRDPRNYSGHSLRRTKAAFVYSETKNLAIVKEMLGHSSLAHTSKYLGVTAEDAARAALKYDL
jgi:integrase